MEDFFEKLKKEISSTIALDFDGVIHKNSKGFHDGTIYDDSLDGTKEALARLSKKYTLIIYTCKANPTSPLVNGKTGRELVWDWLKEKGFAKYISEVTNEKPRAAFYVDDKGIRFYDWNTTLEFINELEEEVINDISKY